MSTEAPTSQQVLDTPMQDNDAGAATVRDYLKALLRTVWDEAEGFSGKRPFGNSAWEYELFDALGRAGYIHVVFDEDGYIDSLDRKAGDKLIQQAIESLS